MSDLLTNIINLTRKNGNNLLNDFQIEMLIQLRDANEETDFIEGKLLTKMEKIIVKYIPLACPFQVNPNEDVQYMISEMWALRPFTRKHSEVGTFWDNLSEVDKTEVRIIRAKQDVFIKPTAAKWVLFRDERALNNGKLPKKHREIKEREEIKGKLDPIMRTALETVTDKFRDTMYGYFKTYFTDERVKAVKFFSSNSKPDYSEINAMNKWNGHCRRYQEMMEDFDTATSVSDETIVKLAKNISKEQSESFFFKMANKLGGLIATPLKEVRNHMMGENNPFRSTLKFDFVDGASFIITNKIVVNTSPLGRPFYQYPCTFHGITLPNGSTVKIGDSELAVKKAFNEFYKSK